MKREDATIFIVDDDASVRRSLRRLLTAREFRVEAFDSAEDYLAREPYEGVGCLLVDLRMPGMGGLALQESLLASGHVFPIVFLTGHGDVPSSVRAMKRGAVDFLTKPVDESALVGALTEALAQHRQAREQEFQVAPFRERVKLLTRREEQVMRLVIAGMMNKEIGRELGIAEKTVKIHRGRMMAKLEPGSVAELVRLCSDSGILPLAAVQREATG